MSAAKSCPHNSLGGAGWCPICSPITDPRPMASIQKKLAEQHSKLFCAQTYEVVDTRESDLEDARKRIAELEHLVDDARKNAKLAVELEIQTMQRANRLSDECGRLKSRESELLAIVGTLTLKLEAAERKAKR